MASIQLSNNGVNVLFTKDGVSKDIPKPNTVLSVREPFLFVKGADGSNNKIDVNDVTNQSATTAEQLRLLWHGWLGDLGGIATQANQLIIISKLDILILQGADFEVQAFGTYDLTLGDLNFDTERIDSKTFASLVFDWAGVSNNEVGKVELQESNSSNGPWTTFTNVFVFGNTVTGNDVLAGTFSGKFIRVKLSDIVFPTGSPLFNGTLIAKP